MLKGADDYLVKPFALREVEARLLALHRRRNGKLAGVELRVGDLVFDTDRLKIAFAGEPVKLPPKSMRLLECMMARPRHVFTRAELEIAIWGEEQETDMLRSHMHTLRRALAQAGGCASNRIRARHWLPPGRRRCALNRACVSASPSVSRYSACC